METKTIFMYGLPSSEFLSELNKKNISYEEWNSEFGFEIRICVDERWNEFKKILKKHFDFNEKDKKILRKRKVDYFIFYN